MASGMTFDQALALAKRVQAETDWWVGEVAAYGRRVGDDSYDVVVYKKPGTHYIRIREVTSWSGVLALMDATVNGQTHPSQWCDPELDRLREENRMLHELLAQERSQRGAESGD